MIVTLANLHEATAQQVFDQVKNHLLTQNERSLNGISCRYREGEGLKCAAGCLMTDSEYRLVFEEKEWEVLISFGWVPDNHGELISDLQNIHDNDPILYWKEALQELASKHNLKY